MTLYNPEKDTEDRVLAHAIREEHLESFLDGNISFAHFSHYRQEVKDFSGRNDMDEGVISLNTPGKIKLSIGMEHVYGVSPPKEEFHELKGLTGVIKFHMADYNCHLFCCTCLSDYKKGIDPRIAGDRSHLIVFLDPAAFCERVKKAVLSQGFDFQQQYVEYFEVDDTPTKPVFFYKLMEYAYQKEFRLAVIGNTSKDRTCIQIGDIRGSVKVYKLDSPLTSPISK